MIVTNKLKKLLFKDTQLEFSSVQLLPCHESCNKLGLNFEELKKIPALLAKQDDELILYINDPSAIDTKAFKKLGVAIYLTNKTEINASWKIYEAFKQAFPKVIKLVEQAHSLGSSEIFLGTPKINSYQFIGEDGLYTGDIDKKVINLIKEYLRLGGDREQEGHPMGKIKLALTKDEEKEVVCIWWKREKKINEESIIILEDETSTLTLLKGLLEGEGYNLKVATDFSNLKSHIKQSNKSKITLLLDAHIHDKVIDEFLINYKEELGNIPIIVLTAQNNSDLKIKLVELGITAFVLKDEDPRVLLAWIKNIKAKRLKTASNLL